MINIIVLGSLRFTELYVDELENEGDLRILVSDYLKCLNPHRNVISGVIRLVITVMVLQVKCILPCSGLVARSSAISNF